MKSKIKKITILGQDYLVKTGSSNNMDKVVSYVNNKMSEAINSGMDINSQQLKIAVFTCLEIAGELFKYKDLNIKELNEIEKKSQLMIKQIDEHCQQHIESNEVVTDTDICVVARLGAAQLTIQGI